MAQLLLKRRRHAEVEDPSMTKHLVALSLVGACLLSGCVAEEDIGTGDPAYASETAILAFHDDWRIEQSGRLVEGGAVRIQYDEARLPGCRGDQNGHAGWTITGYASINEQPAESLYLAGFSPVSDPAEPVIALSEPGDFALWFQSTSVWGCSEFDSNFGTNFHFVVEPRGGSAGSEGKAVLKFGADSTVELTGTLVRGGELRIEYDPARLDDCRGDQGGVPQWAINGYYAVGGGEAQSFYVAGLSPTGDIDVPVIQLDQSGDLALWFQNTNRWGCNAVDSNLGANYHFQVN
jgi:hypothetical protein